MSAMPTTVYYDGECPLCSREIAHYRSRVGDGPVSFVDIMKEDFAPALHGVDRAQARRVLHVKVGNDLRSGLDAVIAMWQVIPGYRWLARLASMPGIHGVMSTGYGLFAQFRPYLQRGRRRKCEADTCMR